MNRAPELLPGIQADLKREQVFEPSARLMIVAVRGVSNERQKMQNLKENISWRRALD